MFLSHLHHGTGLHYELLANENSHAVVLIKEPVDVDVSPSALDSVADSLYAERTPSEEKVMDVYQVMFYYRQDWQGHIYYAGKVWLYDLNTHQMEPYPLDVTGITGNNQQDDSSMVRRHNENSSN